MNQTDPTERYSREAVHRTVMDPPSLDPDHRRALKAIARTVAAQYRDDSLSPGMIAGIMRLVEFSIIFTAGMLLYSVLVGPAIASALPYIFLIAGGAAATVGMLCLADGYDVGWLRRPMAFFGRVLLGVAAAFAFVALATFFLKISAFYSRFWFGSWAVTTLGSLFFLRIMVARLIMRWSRNGLIERRAVIVGGGELAEGLIRQLENSPYNDIRICGIFDDRDDQRSPPVVAGYPKLGDIDDLVEFARIAQIDMLIVTLPLTAESRVLMMLKKLWVLPVDIRLAAHSNALQFRPRSYAYLGDVPTLAIFDRPITDWSSVAKRAFDIVFSLAGLILFAPIMVATAIAIKLDSPGPVFFKQKRHGFNNEEIDVYKFRSMYTDKCDPTARNAVTKGDPRVTPVGRFIRKTSIDELPQFFNSLFGSLSLVGPRPHAVTAQAHDKLYGEVVDGYFARHRVKPGVTGWAQINGWRGEIDSEEKIEKRTEFDLYYIENWSLIFDLKILLLTPISLFNTENAY
ncbi:undecaprenyl-phosphate glucose phosphotransferase [Notoacmeibacter sp. MSK16QG-6]|uniref:undecaprenyl-phosphate glucose phosphotransferase n=1 Tax=Notoacmeibacter sp. MSK16QG-6 TaxID=2957982 RepID=UPI00209C7EBC|nr:undecaprenyl-phosphate glucose phosphotransferase [Notoacmeibacter sp. MSK16QG-6]MCP1198444.1 undecaprenyl-phosphate glucose phosphotransferase [Notoacmeibacter sp. MSK16QG-6]